MSPTCPPIIRDGVTPEQKA